MAARDRLGIARVSRPPFRIAVDARPLAGSPCGYTVYLCSVLTCLRESRFDITLLSDRPVLAQYDEAAALQNRVFGAGAPLRWEQQHLPGHLADAGYDLYFSGANRGIPLRKVRGTRYLLGLLDVIPYLFPRDYFLARWRTLLRHPGANAETVAQLVAVARADAILTISRQSARDIRRVFHRHADAHLIRLKDVAPRPALPPRPHFAYVGGVDARKRVDVLLRAFALLGRDRPDVRLMLVGSHYAAMQPLIAELGLAERVTLTGYVDHETKFRILGESVAMVYPSLYEGYGLAIAEGFQAGVPVIAGSGGSQAEVGGAGTRRIDPRSPEDVAAAMAEMLDPAIRAGWVERGRDQLARLTDPAVATQTAAWFVRQGDLARAGRAGR